MAVQAVDGLLRLPTEVLLDICFLLEPSDVIAVRKTCSALHALTHEKSLWLRFIRWQQVHLPLPHEFRANTAALSSRETPQLQRVAVEAEASQRKWLRRRPSNVPILCASDDQEHSLHSIIHLQLYLRRWMLCVYMEDLLVVWDLDSMDGTGTVRRVWRKVDLLKHTLNLPGGIQCSSAISAMYVNENAISLAVTHNGTRSTTCILRLRLPIHIDDDLKIEFVAKMSSSYPHFVCAISPLLSCVALSRGSFLTVADFSNQDIKSTVIITEDDELDALWNGIIGARFCGPYILCMKTRSVELYPLPVVENEHEEPSFGPHAFKAMKHVFSGHITFRDVTFSSPTIARSATFDSTPDLAISMLASDPIRGLFNFRIRFKAAAALGTPPTFDVTLVEARHMATLDLGSTRMRIAPGSSRGFVSACCLGPQAKRGVWIERHRGSTRRDVSVFDVNCHESGQHLEDMDTQERYDTDDDDDDANSFFKVPNIDGSVVFEMDSYDLRADLTHCAFCEVTGRIVLGTRAGKIMVL
ncbi:hypothetical protein PUNSTDRAFT_51726 [Punctularia strigosozonata HHB-11173 SS5]|uniref:uncharacterized protein n=1 Tax=Punctularia strigosozonata (strain HHB-11173) TaxID=741275 RepID=UPI00044164BC|nr:uncharacterized protein PUNSTDRAFT_51726 [Punctularia strigosozonata HHB-11173 SS5]EIN09449.1 hypothetical protein PUNSTDRAFT_51726 [Punctularia strigosozonata HHB-11173 SS5]